MRTTISIYRQLGKYLEAVDAEAQAKGKGPEDTSIDAHFRSGVYLGVGLSNLILSMMPSRLLTIVELFGYKGDRHAGLAYLQKAGGWNAENDAPAVGVGESIRFACFRFHFTESTTGLRLTDLFNPISHVLRSLTCNHDTRYLL